MKQVIYINHLDYVKLGNLVPDTIRRIVLDLRKKASSRPGQSSVLLTVLISKSHQKPEVITEVRFHSLKLAY